MSRSVESYQAAEDMRQMVTRLEAEVAESKRREADLLSTLERVNVILKRRGLEREPIQG